MSTDRHRRRNGKKVESKAAARSGPEGLRLARGVKLVVGEKQDDVPVLICRTGKVALNGSAVAILRLCDGSRSRDAIIAELTSRPDLQTLAEDITAFLNVARARGWIIEK